MKRRLPLALLLLVFLTASGISGSATSVGLGGGFDPTGLLFMGALIEIPVAEWADLRTQMSIALNSDITGLMLIDVSALAHRPIEFFDPFLGMGIGVALTPRGYSVGFTVNGLAGVRIALFQPISAFLDVHYVIRFTEEGLSHGPIYEAGLRATF
ncbi:MAG: hypothetical protein U9N00_00675 [Candidatus Bipolaricaulota bacterium]|nr:hypothetical protein [Candidatus Bipolaricaulota bacterium]